VETSEEHVEAEASAEPVTRIIKRYANRKLYDTRDSRYVTLQEIAVFVRGTDDVRVIDNRTKEDLTNVTLAQIIYEEEKKGGESRSIPNLRDFIQQSKSRMREGRERLMESLQRGPVGKLVTRHEDSAHEDDVDGAHADDVDGGVSNETATDAAHDASARGAAEKSAATTPREHRSAIPRFADEGLRTLLQSALTHVQQLQAEVGRLGGRIEELEQRLGRRAKDSKSDKKADSERPDAVDSQDG